MKKLIALTLCLCTLLSLGTSAFATTIDEGTIGNSANTTLQYGMDVGYIVEIPDAIRVDASGAGSASVKISNALLPSGTRLDVTILGNSYADGAWHMKDTQDANNKLGYTITGNSVEFASGDVVLTVNAGEAYNSTKTCGLQLRIIDAITKAGTYTDTLTFTVEGGAGIGVSTALAGTYRMLAKKPSVSTAIYVEPNKTNDVAWLLEQYGIPVDSGADLYEGYVLTGITPWLYSYDEAGVPYFFGAGDANWGSRTHGDFSESLFKIFNENEYIYALYAFGFQEFSVREDVTVSDVVRRAFQGTHLKLSDEVRDYYQTGVTVGDFTLGLNVYNTTWENVLRSEGLHYIEQLYKFDLRIENGIVMLYAQGKSAPLQYLDANLTPVDVLATDVPLYYYDAEYDTYRTAYTCDIDLSMYITCENCENEYHFFEMQTGTLCLGCAGVTSYNTFDICGGMYRYDELMTWEQWVNSDYNVCGFYLAGDGRVYAPNGAFVTNNTYVAVNENDFIDGDAWYRVLGTDEIVFTLDGSVYRAKAGMTWRQWVESDYNSYYKIQDGEVHSAWDEYRVVMDGVAVKPGDTISAVFPYTIQWI